MSRLLLLLAKPRFYPRISRSYSTDQLQSQEEQNVHFYDTTQHHDLRELMPPSRSYRYAISLLDCLPHYKRIPPEAVIGWSNLTEPEAVHQDFHEQSAFVNFLHEAVAHFLDRGTDEGMRVRAEHYRQGWMHIGDERALAPLGRAPDADDIVGVCLVKEGNIVPGTYQAMPTHRLFTHIGEFQLPVSMRIFVVQELKSRIEKIN